MIGYSNVTDIAVIHVPELIGQKPFPMSTKHPNMVGEKIVALGTPAGIDNMSSTGYVIGHTVNLTIGTYIYEDLYEITSPISFGSSGGPLIAKDLQKIIAINTAQDRLNKAIGLSMPLYMIEYLISSWIREPMSKDAIYTQFNQAFKRSTNDSLG